MKSLAYAIKLERKLIEEFKSTFYEKVGYIPIVITQEQLSSEDIPYMKLEKLTELFDPFLIEKFGNKIPLASKWRMREIVELRAIYCYIAKQMKYSLKPIGENLGNRDHTTVIHALTLFRNLFETSEVFRGKYAKIHAYIKQQTNSKIK